jgi:hypothetical protein
MVVVADATDNKMASWRQEYLEGLKLRDEREKASYEVIDACK